MVYKKACASFHVYRTVKGEESFLQKLFSIWKSLKNNKNPEAAARTKPFQQSLQVANSF